MLTNLWCLDVTAPHAVVVWAYKYVAVLALQPQCNLAFS